ncbi:efflux RND transporter periplasmic adaptor subunit [Paenibacillus doosanensis]|uniref:Multidrug resistance protein EmrK n=1 Tax=Paenibacillus konkukensis TaxID=2020716 RepID=A0ABY4RT61_9BACL|nr:MULTISPECIES: efflux RND transporter periplasmic adaptor subunit [Paenibacillus]MCS7459551.1 efflux RND transporter periplasmic adaptor subunit [Paenibacillus doosanensis]UQZ84791.1 putative multidrug resistance protein EmrK [Paenibacillus konkukensis]
MSRVILINILVLILILGGAGAAIYYYNRSINYVTTDNAKFDGQPVTVAAIASGQLVEWTGQVGKAYRSGDRLGSIQTAGGASKVDLTLPIDATIVQQSVVPNSFVSTGSTLARGFDMGHLWVTANIEETKINNVKIGQSVDIYADAFPGTTLTGRVDKIGLATASTFSLLPSSNTNANYTKVTQVIPITITLDGYNGLAIVPGMNVSVRIHI